MENIQIEKLKRRPDIIKGYFKRVKDITITNQKLKVVFPEYFIKGNLAIPGSPYKVMSIYAIIDDFGNYAVCLAPVMAGLLPHNIGETIINGVAQKVLYFEKGGVFLSNNDVVKQDDIMYDVFNRIYIQGKIPWYINYLDLSNIFIESKKYSGSNIGKSNLTLEIIASVLSRSPDDKTVLFREWVTDSKSANTKPSYVGLENPFYTYNTTLSKIGGSYYSDGVLSAIVNKETKSSGPADILRR